MNVMRGFRAAGFAAAVAAAPIAHAVDITGAGATFPYPLYAKWAEAYRQQTGIGLNYQSIGSGGGIKQIIAKTVTFGASDMPLKAEELDKNGLVQFPTIFGGEVKRWNDAAIKALNPNAKLPAQAIAVVHRADGSGTTFIFTDYLSKT